MYSQQLPIVLVDQLPGFRVGQAWPLAIKGKQARVMDQQPQ
jgi:hypothetical protein